MFLRSSLTAQWHRVCCGRTFTKKWGSPRYFFSFFPFLFNLNAILLSFLFISNIINFLFLNIIFFIVIICIDFKDFKSCSSSSFLFWFCQFRLFGFWTNSLSKVFIFASIRVETFLSYLSPFSHPDTLSVKLFKKVKVYFANQARIVMGPILSWQWNFNIRPSILRLKSKYLLRIISPLICIPIIWCAWTKSSKRCFLFSSCCVNVIISVIRIFTVSPSFNW